MAATFVGGALLSASLQVIFDRIASPEFLNLFRGPRKHVERLLQKLKDTLLIINVVLDDADNKQFTNSSVKQWLDELQYVVSQADDLVDEMATRGVMQLESDAEEKTITTRLLDFVPFFKVSFQKEMESRLEEILERLDSFAKHKDVLGLERISGRKIMFSRSQSSSLVGEFRVYGLHADQEKILKLLVSDEASANQISVIPIVGMGGIGKTTLAQRVYNDERVDAYFKKKAWVCVSDPFDVFVVTRTILEAVTSSVHDIKDLSRLQDELRKSLDQTKFLLVLDDVWTKSSNDWKLLRKPFMFGSKGSTIIITTRDFDVASMMQTVEPHCAAKLSYEDCLSLFFECAFDHADRGRYPNLEAIGEEIVRKCNGLPLAAVTLGGILRSKIDVREWEAIRNSEVWNLPSNKSEIIPSLMLSYQHLPSHLKRCFAYCSTFPKDHKIKRKKLVLYWTAHNLLPQQSKSQMSLEDIGDLCFRELLSRSFFQQSFGDESRFVMHDLIHDLAQFVSGGMFSSLDDEKPLRTFKRFTSQRYFRGMHKTRNLLHETFPKLRCLRVLCLSNCAIDELPDSISSLIHLLYLNVSKNKIKSLPESTTTIYNLQILLLSYCDQLTKLPQNLMKLRFLRRLDLRGTSIQEMPIGMDRLKSLQFLSTFAVGDNNGSTIKTLGKLGNLREELTILLLENVININDALEANMKGKDHLEDLKLKWSTCKDSSKHEFDVLDKLQPHRNLKKVTIMKYGGDNFPPWLRGDFFHNMISLTLESCENCLILPQLGQLPSLEFLKITGMRKITFVGPEFYGDESIRKPFRALKTLKFVKMEQWEEWHMLDSGDFSCLEELSIVHCLKLTGELPKRVASLKRLEISGCRHLVPPYPNKHLLQLWKSTLELLIISNSPTFAELPRELSNLANLHELQINECGTLESFPDTGLPSGLKVLTIRRCGGLKSFPLCGLSTALERLTIESCRKIKLPNTMENYFKSLKYFRLSCSCDSMKSFPLSFCPNVEYLTIKGCRSIETLSILKIPDNHNFRLKNVLIESCPKLISFGRLPSTPDLSYLQISNCNNFVSLHSFSSSFRSLRDLRIENCKKVMARRKEWGLQTLDSLLRLKVTGEHEEEEEEEDECKTFPEEWLFPASLLQLAICNFPNLKVLNHKGIQHLTSLRALYIENCPQLESLSDNILPKSISELGIFGCSPLLKQRLQKEKGEDWPKISHIRFIWVKNEDKAGTELLLPILPPPLQILNC